MPVSTFKGSQKARFLQPHKQKVLHVFDLEPFVEGWEAKYVLM